MAKTLLDITKNILSDMDSDEVDSIYDTVEALQVATIVLTTLEAEFANLELPSFEKIIQLQSVSDLDRPNYLRYGQDVQTIRWLRYRDNGAQGRYRDVMYLTPSDFFGRITIRTTNGYNTRTINDPSGISYVIDTNRAPTYYTSVDNDYIIFDSYDSEFEDTMEGVNSFTIGSMELAAAELSDDYVPPIPSNLYSLLLAEAKSVCFLTLKQMPNAKAEQVARRQRSRMQNNLYRSRKANHSYARSKYDFSRNR
jgi:hypothetical protein